MRKRSPSHERDEPESKRARLDLALFVPSTPGSPETPAAQVKEATRVLFAFLGPLAVPAAHPDRERAVIRAGDVDFAQWPPMLREKEPGLVSLLPNADTDVVVTIAIWIAFFTIRCRRHHYGSYELQVLLLAYVTRLLQELPDRGMVYTLADCCDRVLALDNYKKAPDIGRLKEALDKVCLIVARHEQVCIVGGRYPLPAYHNLVREWKL